MVDIDPITGLPKDLVSFDQVIREQQRITVAIEKRKFGKKYTIVSGVQKGVDTNDILKKLKSKFACGGTAKGGQIELQGDHKSRIKKALVELGFPEETIEVR
ncbi:stress response translation initiation inhibitor YciH [Candidatus Woesearchaeota archaeon CG10_big_fil_rev_8_21_14_0_10_45_16]|nr:MAG: stress response translation initiation inhibitor YciH [Candidatus Woesearchaeota archaeon CG10_big_fil_rev_8_21_14_0_10_45_16]